MTDEEIASQFERVARELDVPGIEALVSGAERRGRRLRHRRRVLLASGNVLVVVAIVAATTGVVPRLTRALGPASAASAVSPVSARTVISASSSSAASSAASRTASASPATPKAGSRTAPARPRGTMTATQIMDHLRAMLPATSTIANVQDTSARMWNTEVPSVEFNYNDGQGKADVQFGIYPPDLLRGSNVLHCAVPSANGSPRPPGAPPVSCTRKTLPDGGLLIDLVTGTDSWGFYEYVIHVVRPDGVTISLAVGNGTLDPGQPGSNPVTPAITRAVHGSPTQKS